MSHHTLAFFTALGVAAADAQVAAVVDAEFTDRGGNFIFSEEYNALGFYYGAVSALRARLEAPRINGFGRHQIWPVNRALIVPDRPGWQDLRAYPLPLPISEEVGIQASNNLGAATEDSNCLMHIAPPSWNRNLPRGEQQVNLRFTSTVTTIADAWSADTALVAADNLRGGTYAVIGALVQGIGSVGFRLNFRNGNLYGRRKLRPGGVCQDALASLPIPEQFDGFGVWGVFRSLELPAIQIFAPAAAATAHEVRLNCVYLGDSASL